MIATILTVAALATAADQRDWPSAGGFDILQSARTCSLETDYPVPGRSPIHMALVSDGSKVRLILTSMDWSARDGEKYDLNFTLGRWTYTGKATGIIEDYVNKGFIATFDGDFLDEFAAATSLYVAREDQVVANLSLGGSAAASSVLRRCVAHVIASNAASAEQERRFAYIATDPFRETPTPAEPQPATSAGVITDVVWARQPRPEFPVRARERGTRSATAVLECAATSSGNLASCSIISETPSGEGFGRAALEAAQSARLAPQTADRAPARLRFVVSFRAD